MPARYTVIQYVPDPVTEERINIGVAGFSEGSVRTRFLVNWQRVKALAGKDALDLGRLEAIFRDVNEPMLIGMIDSWHNSIQFTTPGSSLRSLDETIEAAAKRFLVDAPMLPRSNRLHADVVSFAKDTMSAAIGFRLGNEAAKSLVRRNMEIPGRFGINRRFDLGVRNGVPLHAIQALSFQGSKATDRQVEAAAFLAEEVRGRLPMTVVVAPPPETGPAFENAKKTLTELGANVVTESDFARTAAEVAEEAVSHLQ